MERTVPLVKVIQRDKTCVVSDMVLRELYEFIVNVKTEKWNLFRPQERLFVEVLLVRLDGDLSRLDDADNMD